MPKRKLDTKQKKNTKSTKSTKARGLGDTLDKVFKKTGIDKVVKFILGEDCGCDKRKKVLNHLFPYYMPECLTEDEFKYLDAYFKAGKNVVHPKTQKKLINIYNRVFHQRMTMTSCGSCFKSNLHNKLERVYKEYLND